MLERRLSATKEDCGFQGRSISVLVPTSRTAASFDVTCDGRYDRRRGLRVRLCTSDRSRTPRVSETKAMCSQKGFSTAAILPVKCRSISPYRRETESN